MNMMLIIQLLVAGLMACVVLIFFIFFYAGRIIIPYISSKMSGVPALLMQMKHGGYRLIKGKYKAGTLETKLGSYGIVPESTQSLEGIKIALAYEGAGATVTPEFIKAAKNLKKRGLLDILHAKKKTKEMVKEYEKAEPERKKQIEDTLKDISVIDDYFLRKMSPIHTQELISNAVNIREGKKKAGVGNVLMISGFAIFLILLGLYIFMMGQKCPTCPDYVGVCKSMYGVVANGTVAKQSIL